MSADRPKQSDQVVIFDMDGVVVDSEPIAIQVCSDVISRNGITVTYEDIDAFVGTPGPVMYTELEQSHGRVLPDDIGHQVQMALRQAYRKDLKTTPGITAMFAALRDRWCIASNSSHGRIGVTLEAVGLTELTDGRVFSADDVSRGKPAPDLFLLAARKLGAEPADCVVIEDSTNGVKAGIAAGMTVIGFTGGGHMKAGSGQRLRDAGAVATFTTMTEVKKFLDSPL